MSIRHLIMLCVLMNICAVHAEDKKKDDKQQEVAGFAIGATVFGGSTAAIIIAQNYFVMTSNFQMAEVAAQTLTAAPEVSALEWFVPGATQAIASSEASAAGAAGSGGSSGVAVGSKTLLDTLAALAPETVAAGLVVIAVIAIALATMPFWLPPILKQSGVANSTLYEVKAYIDFQGAVGGSCSRAHLAVYPYSRKDLGAPWRVVGGDRGRACLPERYGASILMVMRGSVVQLAGSIKDQAKHMKNIALRSDKALRIQWANV